ncbi:MAG: hypothetical protein M9915_11420 [Rhizobacter sp.]|nr:magnesium transporter [Burkholderiaceae bacterium]MCO5124338.1 hypothetical protein [Rhizobacter sp.]
MNDELDTLTVAFLEAHPREAARELEAMPVAEVAALLEALPARVVAPVFAEVQARVGAEAICALDAERATLVLNALRTSGIAATLRHVPQPHRSALLERLPSAQALACRALLRYPDDSVGARAHTEIAVFDVATSASQALDALRREGAAGDGVFVVEVGVLRGWVSAGRLLKAPAAMALGGLVRPILSLPALMPAKTALEAPALEREPVAAVVEHGDRLLGTVTLADLRDAASASAERPNDVRTTALGLAAAGYWQAVAALIHSLLGALFADAKAPR